MTISLKQKNWVLSILSLCDNSILAKLGFPIVVELSAKCFEVFLVKKGLFVIQ